MKYQALKVANMQQFFFFENRSVVRNGIPSTTMGFVAIDLDANTYKD